MKNRASLALIRLACPTRVAKSMVDGPHGKTSGGRGTGFAGPQAPPPRGGNRLHAVSLDGGEPYLVKPSCFMAAWTAGRAAMRSRKAARLAKPEMSTPTRGAQLVTVKR